MANIIKELLQNKVNTSMYQNQALPFGLDANGMQLPNATGIEMNTLNLRDLFQNRFQLQNQLPQPNVYSMNSLMKQSAGQDYVNPYSVTPNSKKKARSTNPTLFQKLKGSGRI